MLRYGLIIFFISLTIIVFADQTTYTPSGKKVLLKDDGTWTYLSEKQNKWLVSDTKDPLDDSQVFICVLIADSGQGTYSDPVSLVVRITKKSDEITFEVYINWNSYIAEDHQEVFYRFDDGEAIRSEANKSTDNKATFFVNEEDVIQQLASSTKFVIRTTPYNENPITAVFDVTGLKEILSKNSIKLSEK